jgi:hypothetical protein
MSLQIDEELNPHPKAHKFTIDKIKYKSDLSYDDRIPEPLPKGAGCLIISGKVASGKSSLALSLLTKRIFYAKKYHKLFVFSPSLLSGNLDEHPIITEIPDDQKFPELTNDNLCDCIESVYGEDKKIAWLFDDCQNEMLGQTLKTLRGLVLNRRHYTLQGNVIFITTQAYNMIDMKIRKNSDVILFRTTNRAEIDSIRKEICSYLTEDMFDELLDYVFDTPHAFLYIKNGVAPEEQFYKNFNPLNIKVERVGKGKNSKAKSMDIKETMESK